MYIDNRIKDVFDTFDNCDKYNFTLIQRPPEHIFVIFMLTLSLLDEETVERNNRPQYKSKAWYYNCSCLWSGMKNLTWNPEFFGEGYNCYCEKCSPPCWNLWLSFYWPIVYILHALKYWNLSVYMESNTCLFARDPEHPWPRDPEGPENTHYFNISFAPNNIFNYKGIL